ncbi:poly(A) polymerase beta-like isoform X2 [Symsagittifera roscoffensis]|uniref:poly(A) polymerase beta-like isoform X2 n=1 Tax=Symsagittifera roscoffensis TaxID=84072 RepID=UPI00307C1F08
MLKEVCVLQNLAPVVNLSSILPITLQSGNLVHNNQVNVVIRQERIVMGEKHAPPAKALGLTGFLCDKLPTSDEVALTHSLKGCLMSFDLYESDQEFQHRVNILARLDHLAKDWIRQMAIKKNLTDNMVEKVGGKLFTFGSYRLGVHTKGADIDTLLVAPRHVEREDFFTSFYDVLSQQSCVTHLRAVEDAFVPVIKMYFGGIEMDILFARLNMQTVTDETDLGNEEVLKNLHISCVRSLNGTRVTDEILKLVPDRDAFRLTLHVIKLWARRKGIYSNVLGFLGGVSWAMLVARVCQLYPRAAPATLVEKFFLVYNCWKWPTPVLLCKPSSNVHGINLPVWDPTTVVADRLHFMPIITPAFPEQNSSYNVSCSTLTIMKDFLAEGFKTVQEIKKAELARTEEEKQRRAKGMAGASHVQPIDSAWSKLFEPFYIYNKYKHFIVLFAQSSCLADHLEWYGLVESKIRILVQNLEKKSFVSLAHVNPSSYDNRDFLDSQTASSQSPSDPCSTRWFIGITFDQNALTTTNVDLTYEIQSFSQTVHHSAYKNGLLKPGMTIEARYVKKKDLQQYLPQNVLKNLKTSRKKVDIDAEPQGRKRKSESSVEMENVEKKTKAMDVSDDEGKRSEGSKLMKLKEELDMAESKKKELICSATSSQPSNTSAPNATVPSAGITSSTSKIGGSLPDGSQVYLCEDVEKEHLDLCVKAEAHVTCLNEDLCQTSEPREDVVKDDAQTEPEVEGVQVDSSSPLNVHHKLKQEVEVNGSEDKRWIEHVISVTDEEEIDDDVIELPQSPPTLLETPLERLTATYRNNQAAQLSSSTHPNLNQLSQQSQLVSKRRFSEVELSTEHPNHPTNANNNKRSEQAKLSSDLAVSSPVLVDKKTASQPLLGIKLNLNR